MKWTWLPSVHPFASWSAELTITSPDAAGQRPLTTLRRAQASSTAYSRVATVRSAGDRTLTETTREAVGPVK